MSTLSPWEVAHVMSHSGNNSNDCKTIETACASIDAALEKTNTTGEIICVDATGGKAYAMASNTSKSIVLRSINGRATIQCSSPLFRAIEAKGGPSSYFVLDGLAFQGGCKAGAVAFDSVNYVVVRNCTFYGNGFGSVYGGALLIHSASGAGLVCNNVFQFNGFPPDGVTANLGGGALALWNEGVAGYTLLVEGNYFSYNFALKGGAVFGSLAGSPIANLQLVFVGNNFDSNIGSNGAGGIALEIFAMTDAPVGWTFNFTRNTCGTSTTDITTMIDITTASGIDGLLYWLEDNTFSSNGGPSSRGALCLHSLGVHSPMPKHPPMLNQTLVVKGGSFTGNYAGYGGAISFLQNIKLTSVTLDGVLFQDNIAEYGGGAIAVLSGAFLSTVTISNCTFINNASPNGNGGAIWMQPGTASSFNVLGSTFVENSASLGTGGALATSLPAVSIVGSTFKGNFGFAGAGALWIGNATTMELHSSHLLGNFGGSLFGGGGLSIIHSGAPVMGASHVIQGNRFEQNTANGGGGAVAFQHLECSVLARNTYTIQNNLFLNNTVNPYGSGAAVAWFNFPPSSSNEVVNNTLAFSGNRYHGNLAPFGGAVAVNYEMVSPYTGRSATVTVSDGNVHYFIDEVVENNSAEQGNGGGMTIHFPGGAGVGGGRNHIWRAIFADNNANCIQCFGGGLHLVNGFSEVALTSFVGNGASRLGSAIGVEGSNASLSVTNSTFMNNVAGDVASSSTGLLSFDDLTHFTEAGLPATVISSAGPVVFPPDENVDCHDLLRSRKGSLLQCIPCPQDTYSLHPEERDHEKTLECHACPGEAECVDGSEVLVLPGYWCGVSAFDPTALECMECPEGYCKEKTTLFNETCVGHRTGLLCGGCEPGYSDAFGTDNCKPTTECDTGANAWFFLVVIGLGLCYIFLLLKFPVNHHPLWKSVVYFMQVVPLIIGAPNNVLQGLFAAFALEVSLFGLSWSVCPWPGFINPIHISKYFPDDLLMLLWQT